MTSQSNSSTPWSREVRVLACRSWGVNRLPVLIALALALASPPICSAQTLSLGSAGQFNLFGAYNAATGASGDFNGGPAMIIGGVGLDANSYLGGSTTIMGAVYESQSGATYAGSGTPGGGIVTGAGPNSFLSQGSQTAINTATTAAGLSNNASVTDPNGTSYQVAAGSSYSGSGPIVVAVNSSTNSSLLNLSNTTITINGTSTEQFVFNFSGRTTLTNVNVVLSGGVQASNVFFNFVTGNVGINGGTINGNILNLVNGTSMSLDQGVVVNGSVVSDGFIDMGNATLVPELPTVMMAGLACLLVVSHGGFNQLRRRSATPSAFPHS